MRRVAELLSTIDQRPPAGRERESGGALSSLSHPPTHDVGALRACIRPCGRLRRAVLAAVEQLTLPVVCNRWARAPAAGLVLRVNAVVLPQAMIEVYCPF